MRLRVLSVVLLIICAALSGVALAQSSQKFDDDFAKAALRALLAIKGQIGTIIRDDGQVMEPRRTQDLIDDAEAKATSTDEKAMARWLAVFSRRRMDQKYMDMMCANQLDAILHSGTSSYPDWCEPPQFDPKRMEACKQYEGKPRHSIPGDCLAYVNRAVK